MDLRHSKADQIYADDIVAHYIDLSRYEEGQARQMNRMFDDLSKDIRKLLDEANRQPGKLTKMKEARLKKLLAATNKTIESRVGTLEMEQPKTISTLLRASNEAGIAAANAGLGVNVLVATMTPNQAEALAKDFIVQGVEFDKLWRSEWDYIKDEYARTLRTHVSYGEGIEEITRSLFDLPELVEKAKGEVSPKWEGRALMTKARSRVRTLARTSVMEASNQGLKNMYEANDDLFAGYEQLSTLDKKTSSVCRGRDGKRWTMDGKPIGGHDKVFRRPPLHPNCRSILQALMKTWEEIKAEKTQVVTNAETGEKRSLQRLVGAKRNAVSKQLRRSEDGLVSKNMSYEQFLRRKGDDYAKDVMGPGRFKLWKDKKISQIDLTDSYGNELTLSELQNLARKRTGGVVAVNPKPILKPALKPKTLKKPVGPKIHKFDKPGGLPDTPKDLDSLQDLTSWAKRKYPQIHWDLHGLDTGLAKDSLVEMDELIKKWPDAAAKLEYIGGMQRPSIKAQDLVWKLRLPQPRSEYAYAVRTRTAIVLNPKFFGNPTLFAEAKAKDIAAKWCVPGAEKSIAGEVVRHEFGHHVSYWLDQMTGKTILNYKKSVNPKGLGTIPRDDGEIGKITSDFMRRNYSRAVRQSRYAATNKWESFAESFTALKYTPIAEQTEYTKLLDKFLGAVGDPRKWRNLDDVPAISSMLEKVESGEIPLKEFKAWKKKTVKTVKQLWTDLGIKPNTT